MPIWKVLTTYSTSARELITSKCKHVSVLASQRNRKKIHYTNVFFWITQCLMGMIQLLVLAWCYYAYVVEFCLNSTSPQSKTITLLVTFHFSVFMFLWSYWKVISSPKGTIPDRFRIPPDVMKQLLEHPHDTQVLERQIRELPVVTREGPCGKIRFCKSCSIIKPDRTHHCGICGKCVLKMDHHSPFFLTCIGFANQKFALLTIFYFFLSGAQIILTSFRVAGEDGIDSGRVLITVLSLFGMWIYWMYASSLWYLTVMNRTVSETVRVPTFEIGNVRYRGFKRCVGRKYDNGGDNLFDMGLLGNLRQVFGEDFRFWLVPVFSSVGNGYSFPIRMDVAQVKGRVIP